MKKKFKMPKPTFPRSSAKTPSGKPVVSKLKPGKYRATITDVKRVKGSLWTTMTTPTGVKLKQVIPLKPKRKYTKRSDFWDKLDKGPVPPALKRAVAKHKATQTTQRTIELVEKSTGAIVHTVPVELEYLATMQTSIARSLDHQRFLMRVRA